MDTQTESRTGSGKPRWRTLIAGAALAVSATFAVAAWAHVGMGGHHGGFGGPGAWMGSPQHVDHAVERMLGGLNATDAQRSQVKQILQQAATDLKTQREAGRALRDKSLQVLAAPTVDAAAAESLRQQMLAQHDAVSRRMLQAMLDVSRVLTPEQRATMAERMKQRHQRMHEHGQRHAPQQTPQQ